MNITFILPGLSRNPSGGFKVIFEYANRLLKRGHKVNIVFDCEFIIYHRYNNIPKIIKKILCIILTYICPRWFKLEPDIKKICSLSGINDRELPDGDVVCATAVMTAKGVRNLSASKGKKLYLIQDFENWHGITSQQVEDTYRYGLHNIVIAKWLEKRVYAAGAECVYIPNGLDFDVYNIDNPINQRRGHVISMQYREGKYKGAAYGIKALEYLKIKYPDLVAILFGLTKRPVSLPKWIKYIHNANQEQLRKIYNQSTVFLCSSVAEGFGLPGAEAMACGAAYVSSDYGGLHEYTIEGRNVLLSPPKDVEGLVRNVSYIFDHEVERVRIATNGYNDIHELDWDKSVEKFEKVMYSD